MTLAVPGVSRAHRTLPVLTVSALLLVLGIGAVAGGGAILFGYDGEAMLPDEYLDMLPLVDSWVIPGLLLGVGFGLGSLVMLYGVLRRPDWPWLHWLERLTRHHWSWVGTIALGVGHMAWITIELVSIPFSFLMPTFGMVALALALLPWLPEVRDYLRAD